MRHPVARPVVQVQLGAGPLGGCHDPLLAGVHVGADARDEPGAPATEQPEAVEVQSHRAPVGQRPQGRPHGFDVVGAQDGIRQVRHVVAVGVAEQGGHACRLEPVPQQAQRTLGALVEEEADRECHRFTMAEGAAPRCGIATLLEI